MARSTWGGVGTQDSEVAPLQRWMKEGITS